MILKFTNNKLNSIAGILKKTTSLIFIFLLFTQLAKATDLYWVGGSGNWGDVNHWSLTSGNTGGILSTSIPQAGDNVIFDANSGFTAANKTVNVNQASICNNITASGIAVNPVFNGTTLEIRGNASYQTGTIINNTLYFKGAGANTVDFNGGVTGSPYIYFQGTGSWLINGTLNSTAKIYFIQGTLNFGSSNITAAYFDESGCCGTAPAIVEPRSLNLGSSIITLTDRNSQSGTGYIASWNYTGTTLNAGTSQINLTKGANDGYGVFFYGKNGHVYNNVSFTNTVDPSSTNSYSWYQIGSGNVTFNTLTFANSGVINSSCTIGTLNLAKSKSYYIYGTQTINTINNPTAPCEPLWSLSSNSSQATINSPNPITLNNVRLNYIKAVGTGPFIANNGINVGGNTGWTFNATPKNLYWIGGGGNWTDPLHWTTNNDGTPITGGCVPTRNDDVFFNSFSGTISSVSPVVINSTDAECKNITWNGVAGTPVFKTSAAANILSIYGSSTWQTGMLYQVATTNYMSANAGNTLTSNGVTVEGNTSFLATGGWIFNDAFLSPLNDINFSNGNLNTNGQAVTVRDFGPVNSGTGIRTLSLGSSLITVNRTWSYMRYFSGPVVNLNAGTSQINMVTSGVTFYYDSGLTYNNIAFTNTSGTSSLNSLGSTAACTINTLTFAGGGSINSGGNPTPLIITNLNLAASKKYVLGTTMEVKVTNLNANTPGCVALLELSSYTAGTNAKLNLVNPTVITNAKVTDINANGATLTVAGGINGGNNLNVLITPTPPRNFYWIGGTGNWSDPTHWTLNTDGTANPVGGCLPNAIDNVFFNQYSGANYTVTLDVAGNCNNMTWEEVAGSAPVLKGLQAAPLNIGGSLVLQTGMDFDVERTNFTATTTGNTITTHGVSMDYTAVNQSSKGVFFYGTGSWTLNDTFNVKNFGLKNGTLNTNNQLINAENYYSEYTTGTTNRILNLGSSTINIAGYWDGGSINTLNAGTSTITINATLPATNGTGGGIYTGNFNGGTGLTYNNVNFTNAAVTGTIYGFSTASANIFNNVAFNGNASIGNSNTFNILTLAPNKTTTVMGGATQTVNNIINNTTCGLWELTAGSQGTIKSANNITFNNAKISNIKATGGGTFSAVGIDNGNNTGITFGTPTGTNFYWIGGSGNWTDPTHWTTNANGTPSGGTCTPTRYDNVFFNQYSGTSPNIGLSGYTEFHDMTWAGVPGTPVLSGGCCDGLMTSFGSMTLQSTLAVYGGIKFASTEPGKTITTNGAKLINNGNAQFIGTGEYIFMDDVTVDGSLSIVNGTLNTNGKTVKILNFSGSGTNTSLILGASNIYTTYNGGFTYTGTNLDAGTSHIYLTQSSTVFTGKDGAIYNSITFTGNANLYGSITTKELIFSATNGTSQIEAGKTITVSNLLQMSGTNCATAKVQSTVAGTQANLCVSNAASTTFNFIAIKDINASCLPFTILPQSTNGGNNTNMTFQPSSGAGIGALGADRTLCASDLPVVLDASGFAPNANSTIQWKNITTNTNLGTAVTQSITAGGKYSVTVNYGTGCTVTDDIIITAKPAAEVGDIIANNINNCNGETSTTLTASLTASSTIVNPLFTWYDDAGHTVNLGTGTSIVVTPTANKSYWVTVKGDNACESSNKQVDVTFGSLAKPTITAGGPTTFCPSGNVILTSSANSGNQWYKDNVLISGEVNQTYVATTGGSYTVINTLGTCTSDPSDAIVITVTDTEKPIKPVLADVTGECGVTVTAPTTTDNCSGTLTGTTNDALTYTTLGTHIITWTFTDAAGNIETATQNVIVQDVTKPVKPVLADVSGECSATVTAPTTTDNCSGTITGTTMDQLTYTTQGTHIITWTFTDAAGNVETATQNVMVKDVTKPVKPVLADVSGECSATVTAPTTTDNCSGTITGTTSDALTYTTQGTHIITWTFTDAAGNIETATQNVMVKDVTKPVKPVLADVSGECSATVTAPTTTDNCSGTITGTTSDALTYTTQGTHIITWTFTDAAGNIETATQNVIVKDVTKPVKPVLADVSGECSATVTAPTTTDNCSGTITGTTSDALTYTTQGTYIITWTFTDAAGNVETATQNVIVQDVTKPVKPVLADVSGECSATATAPTTTDNCSGTLTGTTNDALTYTTLGTHIITWTFTDAAGNIETATQNVMVQDVTKPVKPVLADVSGECSTTVTAPTTTDNCSGTLTGTTSDALTYTTQGTHIITWTFTDAAGNVETATQNVIVKDVTKPVKPVLADVSGECSATVTAPTTTDNCSGTITGTTTDQLTYTTQGTHIITWTFTDAAGNIETATQNVIVKDVTKPVKPVLADVSGECSATATAPTTTDNCSGTITGTTTDQLTYTTQDTHIITWTFTDAAGNIETATQNVMVKDVTKPVKPVLADVSGECSATATAPTTTDNCSGTITGTTTDQLTYTTQGTHIITWTFTDAAGNIETATQNVIVKDVTKPVKPVLADVSGECSATVTAPTTTDNCSGTITGTTSDALTYTTQGTYIITWTFTDAAGNMETATQNVIVQDLTKPVKPVLADVTGECSATVTAPTTTDNCSGTITGTTSDALTYTTQGTHIITWTFTDAAGNIETATQNVIVKDVTKPVKPVLADVSGECSATVTAPTTTDNCSGTITGTTSDALTYTTQGTHIITWTFTDAAGNIETATQNVMVKDVTKPVKPVLADVSGECSATVTAPTTTDNCSGTITGTTSDALTYTTQGTHIITWTFTDAAGNIETATQNVIVKDVTKPVKPVLADVSGECSATVTAPTT
ncbi:hypothetical protein, partial [Pedobacter punctiformis]